MRVTYNNFVLIIFLIFLFSCEESQNGENNNSDIMGFPLFWYFPQTDDIELHGDIQVRAKTIGFGTSQNVHFRAVARFH